MLLARQAHARAQSLLGAGREATAEMAEVIEGLGRAGYSPKTMEAMRARRFHAETQLRSGHVEVGFALLQDLAREQSALQKGQEVEYAQTLDLLGSVLRLAGKPAEALESHRQAASLLSTRLPRDHPYRLRNAIYMKAAEASLRPTANASQELTRMATDYAMRFPEGSYWRRAVAEAFTRDPCALARDVPCQLFL